MEQLIDRYNHLRKSLSAIKQQAIHLPALRPCSLVLNQGASEVNIVGSQALLHEAIKTFRPLHGWLCFQSEIVSFTDGDLSFLSNAKNGWILNGELSNASQESLHIRQHRGAQWQITHYQEVAGTELFCQTMSYLATDEDLGHLAYAVYWKHDSLMGYQKAFSRFTGFQKEATSL